MNNYNEQNKKLLYRYFSTFSQEAYDELYLNNINLVHTYIRNNIHIPYKTENEIDEEYASIGFIALHEAIKSFNFEKIEKVAFSTYATTYIKNAILKQLKKDNINRKRILYYEDEIPSHFSDERASFKDILIDDNDIISQYDNETYMLYRKQQIIKALEGLSKQEREIIEAYYGLNGKNKLSKKEIIEKYDLTDSQYRGIVSRSYRYLREKLKEFSSGFSDNVSTNCSVENIDLKIKKAKIRTLYIKYCKEKVLEAINSLDINIRNIITLYYGIDGSSPKSAIEISKLLNLDYVYVNNVVHKNIDKVIKIVKEPRNEYASHKTKKDGKLKSLYNKYGRQNVLMAINMLDDRGIIVLSRFYGLSGYNALDAKQLAKIYNTDAQHIYSVIHNYQIKIERILEVEKTINENKIVIQHIFQNSDVMDILNAILRLSEKKQNIIKWYLSSKESDIVAHVDIVTSIIDEIKCELMDIEEESLPKMELIKRRQERFYSLLEVKDKKELIKPIQKLDDKEKEFITLYYGLNGEDVSSLSSINKGNCNIRKKLNAIIKKINLMMKKNEAR